MKTADKYTDRQLIDGMNGFIRSLGLKAAAAKELHGQTEQTRRIWKTKLKISFVSMHIEIKYGDSHYAAAIYCGYDETTPISERN